MAFAALLPFLAPSLISLGSSYMAGQAQKKAASTAAEAQLEGTRLGIEANRVATDKGLAEMRYQFDAAQAILKPYVDAGGPALKAQQDMMGLNGPEAQRLAQSGLNQEATGLAQAGEDAILQNASATGGLRGGNTQGALAQFRPQLLNSLIQQRFANLSGITTIGQNSAARQAGNAQQFGANAANLYGSFGVNQSNLIQQGAQATAGNALAQGQATANQWTGFGNAINQGIGAFTGLRAAGAP